MNYINRLFIDNPKGLNTDLHCGAGLFYEINVENLDSIIPIITKKYQTVSSFGFSKEEINTLEKLIKRDLNSWLS